MANINLKSNLWYVEYITPWQVGVYGVTQVLVHKKTLYQEMQIVEIGKHGKCLILDGQWQSCTSDEFLYHEALVHPAMICHPSPRKVLVLGGGEGATIREVLRWKTVERVMMVDIDGEVVEACREHLPEMHQNAFDDPRVELVIDDALHVLEITSEQWDVVISDLSDPCEDGPSCELFTKEYFEKLKRVLAPEGFLVIQAGNVAPIDISLHARIVRTLNTVFLHVHSYASFIPIFTLPWGFVLCSSQPIQTQPNPVIIDQLLADKTVGGFQLLDGISLLGLLQTPVYIRRAIEQQTQIYTLTERPDYLKIHSKSTN